MSKHCSFRAGGLAQDFFIPDDLSALSDFLKNNKKPILILGLGSNLLVRDKGFNGVVIQLKHFNQLDIIDNIIYAGAGTSLAKLSRFCASCGLGGGEFLSAIPGNVGGALAMNAGAFGAEIWSFVRALTTINLAGDLQQRQPNDFEVSYRQVLSKNADEFFLGGEFEFKPTQQKNIQQLLKTRNASQPIGLANCGSVFKNPPNKFAAKLIENSDLKGFRVGGACVSNKHTNFIINDNNATTNDIENLICHIQQTVKSKFNIDLETEVKII